MDYWAAATAENWRVSSFNHFFGNFSTAKIQGKRSNLMSMSFSSGCRKSTKSNDIIATRWWALQEFSSSHWCSCTESATKFQWRREKIRVIRRKHDILVLFLCTFFVLRLHCGLPVFCHFNQKFGYVQKSMGAPQKMTSRMWRSTTQKAPKSFEIQLTCFFPQILTFLVTELLKFPDVTKLEAKARELEQTLLGTSSSSAHFSPFFPKETN